ncbi:hypothetical protein C8J56DRAFT_929731 [Mycena floridula]|nr:hypothetical protein C8J56DRAFT_929731 [Mycena floridula]
MQELLLFAGFKAYFSPSVPRSLKSAFLENGGKFTVTAAESRQADFFFCAGPSDPLLSELLSRNAIVRHAQWITKVLDEGFLVPYGDYTLDDFFDAAKITGPRRSRHSLNSISSTSHGSLTLVDSTLSTNQTTTDDPSACFSVVPFCRPKVPRKPRSAYLEFQKHIRPPNGRSAQVTSRESSTSPPRSISIRDFLNRIPNNNVTTTLFIPGEEFEGKMFWCRAIDDSLYQ